MSLLTWLGKRVGLTDSAFWRAYFRTETWAGEDVSPDVAMQVAAFWACVRLIAQTLGTLPLNLYERQADGSRKVLADDQLHKLVRVTPNGEQTPMEFWEGMGANVCLHGNSFAYKVPAASGQGVIALDPLIPDCMTVERTVPGNGKRGVLQYRYRDPLRGSVERIYKPDEILHIKGFGFGGDVGLSPVAFARQSLGSARAIERTSASMFANGMRPSGFLVYKDGTLDEKQREQVRKSLIEPLTGSANAGKIGVLEADFDYRQMTIPPEEAQMIQSRQFSVEDICRWFGVPPILIGHAAAGQTMWGSGVEQILLGWLTLGVTPYLNRFMQAADRALLSSTDSGRKFYAFDVEALLAADSAARSKLYTDYVQNGIMTRNEIRAKLNLPKEEGGDLLTVQSQMVPLEKLEKDMENPQPVPAAPGDQPIPQPAAEEKRLRVVR